MAALYFGFKLLEAVAAVGGITAGVLLVIFTLNLTALTIHEVGHASAGWLVGFRIRQIHIGPFLRTRGHRGFEWSISPSLPLWLTGSVIASPLGADRTLVREATCNAPAQIAARSKPVPVLPAQPAGEPPVTFLHEPCIKLHREANLLFIVDLVVMAGLIGGGVWFFAQAPRRRLTVGA